MVSSTEFNVMLSACVMLFSMKMIKNRNWRFVSERAIIAEDVYSLMNLFSSVKSVCFISKALYYYCRNEESLTHTYREDRYDKIKFYYDESIKMCQENGYNENVQSRVGVTYFSFTIAAMKQIVKSKMEFEEYHEKRKAAQVDEATELVKLYRERYGKEPDEHALHEFFWLFTNGEDKLPECWDSMMKLGGNYEYSKRTLFMSLLHFRFMTHCFADVAFLSQMWPEH